jgi:MFS family permease
MSEVMSSIGASGAVAAALAPWLSDRFGRRGVMAGFAALGVVAPLAALYVGPHPAALIVLIALSCLMTGIFPLFMGTVPMETVPLRYAATTSAVIIGAGQVIGGMAGPLVGGALADRFGLQTPLWICAVLAAAASLICAGLRETAPRRLAVEAAPRLRTTAGASHRTPHAPFEGAYPAALTELIQNGKQADRQGQS